MGSYQLTNDCNSIGMVSFVVNPYLGKLTTQELKEVYQYRNVLDEETERHCLKNKFHLEAVKKYLWKEAKMLLVSVSIK